MMIRPTGSYDATCQNMMRTALRDILADGEPVEVHLDYEDHGRVHRRGTCVEVTETHIVFDHGDSVEFGSVTLFRLP